MLLLPPRFCCFTGDLCPLSHCRSHQQRFSLLGPRGIVMNLVAVSCTVPVSVAVRMAVCTRELGMWIRERSWQCLHLRRTPQPRGFQRRGSNNDRQELGPSDLLHYFALSIPQRDGKRGAGDKPVKIQTGSLAEPRHCRHVGRSQGSLCCTIRAMPPQVMAGRP